MIRQDQLDRLDELIRQARATGNGEVLLKSVDLLGKALQQMALDQAEEEVSDTNGADPMSRARAREDVTPAVGLRKLRKLRKGRERCTGTRRDGWPCQAPAVEGTLVCRRHGGSAPQVLIKAQHFQLQMALYSARLDWGAARGTPGEFDALCKVTHAERDLDAYEVKLRLLAELSAELKRRRAAQGTGGR